MAYGGVLNHQGIAYFAALFCASILLLPRLLKTNIDRPEDCRALFLGTPLIGQVILGGLVIDAVAHRLNSGIPL